MATARTRSCCLRRASASRPRSSHDEKTWAYLGTLVNPNCWTFRDDRQRSELKTINSPFKEMDAGGRRVRVQREVSSPPKPATSPQGPLTRLTERPFFHGNRFRVEHRVVQVIPRDRFEQFPRKRRFGFSAQGRTPLQKGHSITAQPDGALVGSRPPTATSRWPQADLRLRAAHLERADIAPKLLGDVVGPHVALRNHLRDGGQHSLGQNSASHSHPLIGQPGSMLSRLNGAFGSILGRNITSAQRCPCDGRHLPDGKRRPCDGHHLPKFRLRNSVRGI